MKKKNQNQKPVPKLVPKKVKARIFLLKAIPYKGSMVYLRHIPLMEYQRHADGEVFMFDVVFEGQVYSGSMIFIPRPGKRKLAKWEVAEAAAMLFSGAVATIDIQLGIKLDKKTKKTVRAFESARDKVVH